MITVDNMRRNETMYDIGKKLDTDNTNQKQPDQEVCCGARRVSGFF
jgi:hypothetical protein